METRDYLDFDEAVDFLKTTPSTLYKWLHSGKIPGHKLGRQWRFLREELELQVTGKAPKLALHRNIMVFAELLNTRALIHKEKNVETDIRHLSEKMIWDAFDHGSRTIHLYPSEGEYLIKFKNPESHEILTKINEDLFQKLDEALNEASSPMTESGARRSYFQRENEAIQVRYQKVETITGPRITLHIWQPKTDILPFEKITKDSEVLSTFKSWTTVKSGIILIGGAPGSGKTTTMHSFLHEFQKEARTVFTIESSVELLIDGVAQVELRGRGQEDFMTAYHQVTSSDADVIGLGLGSIIGIERAMLSAACESASAGRLMIIQTNESSYEDIMNYMKKFAPINFEQLMIGVSTQELIPQGKKMKAEYELVKGARMTLVE